MTERDFSETTRGDLSTEGAALPDGSYPTPDCDALRRAFEAYGRESPDKREALRHYLIKRNIELGCHHPLPESWHMEVT